jgi:hypothetical protein
MLQVAIVVLGFTLILKLTCVVLPPADGRMVNNNGARANANIISPCGHHGRLSPAPNHASHRDIRYPDSEVVFVRLVAPAYLADTLSNPPE